MNKGVQLVKIVDKALDAEHVEKDILDEERAIKERQARETNRGFRSGFQGGKGRQTQGQCLQDTKRKITPVQQPQFDQDKHPRIDQKTTTIGLPQCAFCCKFHNGECHKRVGYAIGAVDMVISLRITLKQQIIKRNLSFYF